MTPMIHVLASSACLAQVASARPSEIELRVRTAEPDEVLVDERVAPERFGFDLVGESAIELPWAELQRVTVEEAHEKIDGGRVVVSFLMKGEEREQRRVMIELRAWGEAGTLVDHTWEVQPDQRTFAREENDRQGPRGFVLSPANSATLRLDLDVQQRVRRLELTLRHTTAGELERIPQAPHPYDLTLARGDTAGNYSVSLAMPRTIASWDPDVYGLAVRLDVKGPDGELARSELRRPTQVGADGRFRAAFDVAPDELPLAGVSVFFFTLQDSGWTIEDHLAGREHGHYGGIWLQDGGALAELPWESGVRGRRETSRR